MHEMRRSMQNNMAETAWPKTQYLWRLHPILNWVNDKASLLFKRDEAPIIGIPQKLSPNESIYIASGTIPNRKSTALVDEWFGLLYRNGEFARILSMDEVVAMTGIGNAQLANTQRIGEAEQSAATRLLEDVVDHAKSHLKECFDDYQQRMNPLLDEEVDKLATLQSKHHRYYQMTLFDSKRKLEEKERSVDELFEEFINWVTDTLTIQDNPYIKIVAVLMGVAL
jgi:hypothetical protein